MFLLPIFNITLYPEQPNFGGFADFEAADIRNTRRQVILVSRAIPRGSNDVTDVGLINSKKEFKIMS